MASQIAKEIRVLGGMAALGFAGWGSATWWLARVPMEPGWAAIAEQLGRTVGLVSLAALLVVTTMTNRLGVSEARPLHKVMIWKTLVWTAIGGACLLASVFAPNLLPKAILLFVFATALLGVVITGVAAWVAMHVRR